MGYTTEFHGSIAIDPPLSKKENAYLKKFALTRRMSRGNGPYYLGQGDFGQAQEPDIHDFNKPPSCQPGLWCQWEPKKNGSELAWNQSEKFYDAAEWMAYIRSHFLVLAAAKQFEPASQGFWSPHAMRGEIIAVGEDASEDVWALKVDEEGVWTRKGEWTKQALAKMWPIGKNSKAVEGCQEALDMLVENPLLVKWEPKWTRVDDFIDAGQRARFEASRQALDIGEALGEAGKLKRKGPKAL